MEHGTVRWILAGGLKPRARCGAPTFWNRGCRGSSGSVGTSTEASFFGPLPTQAAASPLGPGGEVVRSDREPDRWMVEATSSTHVRMANECSDGFFGGVWGMRTSHGPSTA